VRKQLLCNLLALNDGVLEEVLLVILEMLALLPVFRSESYVVGQSFVAHVKY
jgi:hypothetical protein